MPWSAQSPLIRLTCRTRSEAKRPRSRCSRRILFGSAGHPHHTPHLRLTAQIRQQRAQQSLSVDATVRIRDVPESENREPNRCERLGDLRHRNTQAERGRLAQVHKATAGVPGAGLPRARGQLHRAAPQAPSRISAHDWDRATGLVEGVAVPGKIPDSGWN
jgi:hypothetical protein